MSWDVTNRFLEHCRASGERHGKAYYGYCLTCFEQLVRADERRSAVASIQKLMDSEEVTYEERKVLMAASIVVNRLTESQRRTVVEALKKGEQK